MNEMRKLMEMVGSLENAGRFQWVIDGYGYNEETDVAEPDEPAKIWHFMTTPSGERITLNHSPYESMDKDEFAMHVAKHKGKTEKTRQVDEEDTIGPNLDDFSDDLYDRIDILRDALKEIQAYAESKYREGDYGYQFAILAREALKRA